MQRYKVKVEYLGTPFVGWQSQKENLAIQDVVNAALFKYTQQKDVNAYASGRTDAGVHATGQICHIDLIKSRPVDSIIRGTNYFMQKYPVKIISCEPTDSEFHARFSAKKRHYLYKINNRKYPLAIDRDRVWWIPQKIDLDLMQQAAELLLGTHDFTSFRALACQAKSPIKSIDHIHIKSNDDIVDIHIAAQSFLHHMVRNIVGTLVLVGQKRLSIDEFKKILLAKDRSEAGATAPSWGLYLSKVEY